MVLALSWVSAVEPQGRIRMNFSRLEAAPAGFGGEQVCFLHLKDMTRQFLFCFFFKQEGERFLPELTGL